LARKDRDADLRWLFEELRVAIFAPELKTPVPVSVAKVKEALSSRGRG
jgi:ATP-dependent helicase HrpA